jgi:hypothetical protein
MSEHLNVGVNIGTKVEAINNVNIKEVIASGTSKYHRCKNRSK